MIAGKVSVVIPVYNGERFLEDCIASAINQGNADLEIIVVNDGSSDNSPEIIRKHAKEVQIINQENAGPAAARHRGVMASTGEFVAFLDQDDVWDANKLERQLDVFRRYPDALAVYCDHRTIDSSGNIIGKSGALLYPRVSGQVLDYMIRGTVVLSASLVMVRRTAYDSAGGLDVNHSYWADDYDLWMRIAAQGPFLYQLETLVSYRRHSHNTSGSDFEMAAGLAQAFRNLEAHVVARQVHRKLWPLIHDARFKAELALAWHHRKRHEAAQAIRNYLAAIRLKPLNLDAWRGLALAFYFKVVRKR